MVLRDAETLARIVIRCHLPRSWKFRWSKSRDTRGECFDEEEVIVLSRSLTKRAPLVDVYDTLLHEVAHALTPHEEGHGKEWRKVCRLLGAMPRKSSPRVLECKKRRQ